MNLNYKNFLVMGHSNATAAETVLQFGVMVPFEISYPAKFTGKLKWWTINACWPMTNVSARLSSYVNCSPSYIRTALTQTVMTTEATYHSRKIICLVNAGFLLLVVGGAVPGASGSDIMISTNADTCFTRSSITPPPLNLTFFYTGLCPLACIFLYSATIWW